MLIDVALTQLVEGKKVVIHIDNEDILNGMKAYFSELTIHPEYRVNNRAIKCSWSSNDTRSPKALKMGQALSILGNTIGEYSILEILRNRKINTYVPIFDLLQSAPSTKREVILREIRQIQNLKLQYLDYQWLYQRIKEDHLEMKSIEQDLTLLKEVVKRLEEAIVSVQISKISPHDLRRQNHKTGLPEVVELFKVKSLIDRTKVNCVVIALPSVKNPLNAFQLMNYLNSQLIEYRKIITSFSDYRIQDWFRVIKQSLPLSQRLAKQLAIYSISSSWVDLIRSNWATIDSHNLEYSSTRITYEDALFYLKSYIGDMKDRLIITPEINLNTVDMGTVHLVPKSSNLSNSQIIQYKVCPSDVKYVHTDGLLYKKQLTDSELLINARILSDLLVSRFSNINIYINREHIICFSLPIDDLMISDWLIDNQYEKLIINDEKEAMTACFIDQNRQVNFILLGYLMDIKLINDWIHQVRIIETLQNLGVRLIDIPFTITSGNSQLIVSPIIEILNGHFAD